MQYFFALALATGFGVALAAFGGSLGQARAIAAALEGVARQPEAGPRLLTLLIIGLAFVESLTIYALVMSLLLWLKLPAPAEIMSLLKP
ncbi:MAG: ATP synthase F0 subunit C [Armatimonadota bacterium]|nr:MAG: ATP synthase F0 subunit C [Armatimonadota bacterium]